jgi:hypothetical protein
MGLYEKLKVLDHNTDSLPWFFSEDKFSETVSYFIYGLGFRSFYQKEVVPSVYKRI